MTQIQHFYDERTNTLTYVVYRPETKDAIVVDPVLDYDPAASKTWTESVDAVLRFLKEHGLQLKMILETHAHADHLSGAPRLKKAYPEAVVGIGRRITEVQRLFRQIFDLPADFATDGSQFDRLFEDGETFHVDGMEIRVMYTPGHTPACASYLIDGQYLFTGDTLFQPDQGTGRCDFPGGSADDLYTSVHERLYQLPDEIIVYPGHDYQPEGREVQYQAPLSAHKQGNVMLNQADTREAFVKRRQTRDATLSAPKLLFQSVQVNIDAGRLPEPSATSGKRYLKIPINAFRPEPQGEMTIEGV